METFFLTRTRNQLGTIHSLRTNGFSPVFNSGETIETNGKFFVYTRMAKFTSGSGECDCKIRLIENKKIDL